MFPILSADTVGGRDPATVASVRIAPALDRRSGILIWLGAAVTGVLLLLFSVPVLYDWQDPDTLPDDRNLALARFLGLQIYTGIASLALFAVSLSRGRRPAMLLTVFLGAVGALGAVASVVALVRLSRHGRPRDAVCGGVAVGAGGLLGLILDPDGVAAGELVLLLVVAVVTVSLGRFWASRDANEHELDRLRMEQVVAEDRLRLARDIHDSLSHRLGLIAIHSGALDYRGDLSGAQTTDAIATIRHQSEAASNDLRDIITALRITREDEDEQRTPGHVIEEARERGTVVEVSAGFPDDVLVESGLSALAMSALGAMLRETLNNADRHAPGVRVSVGSDVSEGSLTVSVSNPVGGGTRGDGAVASSGFGLVGVRERAVLAGGHLRVSDAGEHFAVTIGLPWQGVDA